MTEDTKDTFDFNIDTTFLDVFSTDYKYEELTPEQRDIHNALFPSDLVRSEPPAERSSNLGTVQSVMISQKQVNDQIPVSILLESELGPKAEPQIVKPSVTTKQTNVIIKSLSTDVTEEVLKKAFEKYGQVTDVFINDCEITEKRPTGRKQANKYGIVNFSDATHANNALTQGKNDPEIKGLIDINQLPSVEFLYTAQSEPLEYEYLMWKIKAKKSAESYKKNQEYFESIMK